MADSAIVVQVLSEQVVRLNPGRMLDYDNSDQMIAALSDALSNGRKYIIVDMVDLEFLSSAGVGALIGTVGSYRAAGGDIILCNVSPTIQHVLSVLDLLDFFTFRETVQDALVACGLDAKLSGSA